MKIRYENTNLLKKMIEVENKPSSYHPVKLQVKDCPAFYKTGFVRNQTLRKIQTDNNSHMSRMCSARTFYPKKKLEKSYKTNLYYESMISKRESMLLFLHLTLFYYR